MNMKEDLLKALKEAMQEKNEIKKNTITLLRASILQIEKDEQKELTQQDMEVVVSKEIKKRKESIPEYEKAQRTDIVDNLKEEINILEKYLPTQLTHSEIKEMVLTAIKETSSASMRDMGKVMGFLKDKTAGKADGKVVSDIVKEELSKI